MADGISSDGMLREEDVVEEKDWPNCTDPTNLDTWPTKQDVMERLELSEKTIERRIQEGKLRKDFRIVPGRKPLPILHPEDVKALLDKKLEPTPVVVKASPPAKKQRDEMTLSPAMLTDMAKTVLSETVTGLAASSPWALHYKHYLTIKEASCLTGLSEKWLRKRCKNGVIPSVKDGGYKIRRLDLERYYAVTDSLDVTKSDETALAA